MKLYDAITKEGHLLKRRSKLMLYGSIYMDAGERWNRVESQLRAFEKTIKAGGISIGFGFDFFCLTNQVGKAYKFMERLAREIKRRIRLPEDKMPKISTIVLRKRGDDPRYGRGIPLGHLWIDPKNGRMCEIVQKESWNV